MRKDSLEPEDFEEDAQLHTKCGIHVQVETIMAFDSLLAYLLRSFGGLCGD